MLGLLRVTTSFYDFQMPVDQAIARQGQPNEAAGVTLHGAGYAGWPPIIEFGDLVGFLCQAKDLFFYVTLYDLIMRVQVWPYKIVCRSFHDWISCFYELMRLILLTCIYQSTAQLLLSLIVAAVVVFSCHWYDPLPCFTQLSQMECVELWCASSHKINTTTFFQCTFILQLKREAPKSKRPFFSSNWQKFFSSHHSKSLSLKNNKLAKLFPPWPRRSTCKALCFCSKAWLTWPQLGLQVSILEGTCIWA